MSVKTKVTARRNSAVRLVLWQAPSCRDKQNSTRRFYFLQMSLLFGVEDSSVELMNTDVDDKQKFQHICMSLFKFFNTRPVFV